MSVSSNYFPDELKEVKDTIAKIFNNFYGSNDMAVYLQNEFEKSLDRAYKKFDDSF